MRNGELGGISWRKTSSMSLKKILIVGSIPLGSNMKSMKAHNNSALWLHQKTWWLQTVGWDASRDKWLKTGRSSHCKDFVGQACQFTSVSELYRKPMQLTQVNSHSIMTARELRMHWSLLTLPSHTCDKWVGIIETRADKTAGYDFLLVLLGSSRSLWHIALIL